MENNLSNRKLPILMVLNILVIILVGSLLRSPISALGPVLQELGEALTLDNFQSSLLTSIPLMMFAICSVFISKLSQKFSIPQLLLYALTILAVGLFLRVFGNLSSLFSGSVLIGLGICIGNVITPGYIKINFPKQLGLMTGVFAVAMSLTAALASGFSLRIGQWTGLGWQGSLGIWGIVALIGIVVSIVELFFNKGKLTGENTLQRESTFNSYKSRQAWNISIFMGLQSAVYYSLISWLPAVLHDFGMTGDQPGWVLFAIQIAMLPISFIGPIIANRMSNQRQMMFLVCVAMLASMLIFVWFKADFVYTAAILLGLSNGLSFSLAILFFSLRTKTASNAIKISGMAQSIGYLIAAFGPLLFGKLHDWDQSWQLSFYALAVLVMLMFYFGMKAASNRYVED